MLQYPRSRRLRLNQLGTARLLPRYLSGPCQGPVFVDKLRLRETLILVGVLAGAGSDSRENWRLVPFPRPVDLALADGTQQRLERERKREDNHPGSSHSS